MPDAEKARSRSWELLDHSGERDPRGVETGNDPGEQFRLVLESSPTGMIVVDQAGTIVFVNVRAERLFGYQRHELVGAPLEMLVPERFRARHADLRQKFFSNPQLQSMDPGRDLLALRKDGTEVPVEIGLSNLRTAAGDFVVSSIVDISACRDAERERDRLRDQLRIANIDLAANVKERLDELRVANIELTATVKEREVLLQEIHHRVKNNLQVISSMINMQVRRIPDGASRNALKECQTRVHAIALIHEKLYQSDDFSLVPFADYARSLSKSVFEASHLMGGQISLDLAFQDVALTVDKAIPTGLILNELITNALKHAFPEGRRGVLRVGLSRTADGYVTLFVGDDGIGLRAGFDLREAKSLGLQIVSTLAEQLQAILEVNGEAGTSFRMTFHEGDS